ncbi:hypothetical protein M422DRAFT_777841 [Sphaerobolus stellatus SS14]|nr:hypothetical protein M422DRAFT_777841 [Sphaerobolus stellatus SS14]
MHCGARSVLAGQITGDNNPAKRDINPKLRRGGGGGGGGGGVVAGMGPSAERRNVSHTLHLPSQHAAATYEEAAKWIARQKGPDCVSYPFKIPASKTWRRFVLRLSPLICGRMSDISNEKVGYNDTGDVKFAAKGGMKERVLMALRAGGEETQGIDRVPEDEHEGTHNLGVFTLWMSMFISLTTIPLSMLGQQTFTLTFDRAVATAIRFAVIGCCCLGFISTLRPQLGMRTMVVTRYSFGYWGATIIAVLNVLTQGEPEESLSISLPPRQPPSFLPPLRQFKDHPGRLLKGERVIRCASCRFQTLRASPPADSQVLSLSLPSLPVLNN